MSNLISFTKQKALKLISRTPYFEITNLIKKTIESIKKIQNQDIHILNQTIDALILTKTRLEQEENTKTNLVKSPLINLNEYQRVIETSNSKIKIQEDNIKKLSKIILDNITQLTNKIIALTLEIDEISDEITKYDNYYLNNLNENLSKQNEIIKAIKLTQELNENINKFENKNLFNELNKLSEILKEMQNYKHVFEEKKIVKIKD